MKLLLFSNKKKEVCFGNNAVILDYDTTKNIFSNPEPSNYESIEGENFGFTVLSASYKQCAGWALFHRDPIMILYMAQASKVRKVAQSLLSSS